MSKQSCPICHSSTSAAFRGRVLNRHEVTYYFCDGCGLLQTQPPYWLDEAYADAISRADTGIIQRNLCLAGKLPGILYALFGPDGHYLDLAGGYGLLVRLMRDFGFDFYWEDKYCQNLLAPGFEIQACPHPVTAVTAFEVLEHIHDPLAFVEHAVSKSDARILIFSTELFSDKPPPANWWYYAFETGQHISFFQRRTFDMIAAKLGLKFITSRSIHAIGPFSSHTEYLLRTLTSPISYPLSSILRRIMSSKTLVDHEKLLRII
jgi:hypothetical protein